MLSWTRSSASKSEARRPRRLRGFARVGLVVGWVVFWLNTALFPCFEVAAAVLGGHADNGSLPASAASPLHDSNATYYSEPLDHSSDAPCGYTIISGPPTVGEHEALTSDRSHLEWLAVDAPAATGLAAVNGSANVTLAGADPPPSLRLYLRTQRLRI